MATKIPAQSPLHFQHSESTKAPAAAIWAIWIDIDRWPEWDRGLKKAQLKNGPFAEGAKGRLTPDKGPKAKFIITDVKEGQAYTLKTRIPFGWLIVRRYLKEEKDQRVFTHEVEFTGLFKKLFARQLGKRYQKMLPEVLQKIKELAEQVPG
ncbi:MAG: SRPBCC family protein [Bacteroidota bacterium]